MVVVAVVVVGVAATVATVATARLLTVEVAAAMQAATAADL